MDLAIKLVNTFFRRFIWQQPCLHLALLVALPLLMTTAFAEQPTKRVLVFSNYDSNLPGVVAFDRALRSTVRDGSPARVEFFYEAQENTRIPMGEYDQELVSYLRRKYANEKFDLIITVGAPSLKFLTKHEAELFTDTPRLFFFYDEREELAYKLSPHTTGIWVKLDMAETLETALALHPETQRVFVVSGNDENNKFLTGQAQSELQKYESKVEIAYLSNLTIDELKDNLATLPGKSVVLFLDFALDRAGDTFSGPEALSKIAPTSSAPIYGISNTYIGAGVVGGNVIDFDVIGERTGKMALRILAGERPEDISPQTAASVPVFDWRELRRWGISEDRLPPGSIVQFRVPSIWDEYKWYLLGIVFLIVLQTAMISRLLLSRSRRKRVEAQNRTLIGQLRALSERLRTAKEEEGIRIARELHDELGGTLTALKWSIEGIGEAYSEPAKTAGNGHARTTIEEMVSLIDGTIDTVRRISSELRPGMLDELGLIPTIERHAQQFQGQTGIICRFDPQLDHVDLSREQSTAIFRIFQEAMTNVLRHAQATKVNILIEEDEGELVFRVRDNGSGITDREKKGTLALGLLGMRERAHSIGARIEIDGIAGEGTSLIVRLPLSS